VIVVPGTGALDGSHGRLFLVVGVFDGLHLGHEYLLHELRRAAAEHAARPAVITFDHHPDEILKGAAPPLLCDPEERLRRLDAAGVEVTVIEVFDRALRETPYDVWIAGIAERVDLAGFLMTPESAFGYERGGNPVTVAALGRSLHYEVVVTPQFTLDGQPVRSSDIRSAIATGDLERAARLLGRPVSVIGTAATTSGDRTDLAFDLPVALPPSGRYEVLVRTAADGVRRGELEVTDERVALTPALAERTGERLTIELVRTASATIRRS
jgi:riboflavin kinase / FMN adenylyltransferase